MNEYLKNLNRIEFIVTRACTGRCRHCQNGDPDNSSGHIDPELAADAVRRLSERYSVESVMTFGGEPLLYPDVVCAIHRAAAGAGIGIRQLITNGFFSNEHKRIETVVRELAESGVNDLLLSADAFHQETIPTEPVKYFAECAVRLALPITLQPSWLVSREDGNPYNMRTREVLREFDALRIPVDPGNVVFPMGNARKYLAGYFDENTDPSSPYDEDPRDIRAISFEPNGDVLNGNAYKTDILEIIEAYRPD